MSYMNRKKILTEGFFDILKKFLKKPKLSSKDKKLLKDPEFKRAWDKYTKMSKDTEKSLQKALDKQGIKSRFK